MVVVVELEIEPVVVLDVVVVFPAASVEVDEDDESPLLETEVVEEEKLPSGFEAEVIVTNELSGYTVDEVEVVDESG